MHPSDDPAHTTDRHRHDRLLRVATSMLGSREMAEEVVQEALLRHLERADATLREPDAWLIRVTRNLAVDRLRRRRLERVIRPPELGAGFHGGEGVASPYQALEHRERCREAVRRMLARSLPRDVAAALLHEVFGTDHGDLARLGGRSRDSCRQAVHRALRRARETASERDVPEHEPAERGTTDRTRADAVLDRFANAVLEGDPAPLFEAIRAEPCTALATLAASATSATGSLGRRDVVRLHVEIDAVGARVSLRLGDVLLCTMPRPARRPLEHAPAPT